MDPKYPDVEVQLTGEDGNIFFIGGRVGRALKNAGHRDVVDEFYRELTAAGSYTEALAIVNQWVYTY